MLETILSTGVDKANVLNELLASKRGKEKIDDIESRELDPSFADLPLPITTDILLRHPIKLVLICKHDELPELDSKCSNILKLEPTFKLPLRDGELDWWDDGFHVVNSCNGLPSPTFFRHGFMHNSISMGAFRDSLYVCNASLPSSVDVCVDHEE
ncbi:F-box and associated interaction domain protein [Trifolium pratense]|uniref:F-box and associated interaction domain protein n=1 Tax=Trifolium pratense TaxID=57577 RepID=A0A2K3PB84_TRIPR|nr:F-box and associated interaction domain protein [Trifolium pratense]